MTTNAETFRSMTLLATLAVVSGCAGEEAHPADDWVEPNPEGEMPGSSTGGTTSATLGATNTDATSSAGGATVSPSDSSDPGDDGVASGGSAATSTTAGGAAGLGGTGEPTASGGASTTVSVGGTGGTDTAMVGTGGGGGDPYSGGATGMGGSGGGASTGGAAGNTAGMVPMFVAAGYSARTMTSCDDGQTWFNDHFYEPSSEGGGQNECGNAGPCNRSHQDLTEKGLAYGNGLFMQIVGWGAGPSVKFSRNGIDWTRVRIPRDIVRIDANIVFLEEPTPRFVALSGYGGMCAESVDGEEWVECPVVPQYSDSMREAGGGGAVIGAAGNSRAIFTFDGGQTWGTSDECGFTSQFGNLGQDGGFMWGNDRFVVVNDSGSWCHTDDLGATWDTGSFNGGAVGKASFSGGRFWAPNGRSGHWSEDGTTWNSVEFQPSDVRIHAIATSDSGTMVGIERLGSTGEVSGQEARFYRSEDGENWTMSTGPAGTMFRRVIFGYGEPSEQCPAP